jgi:hypothetical protein
MGGHPHHGPIQ